MSSLLDHYWPLASENPDERINAAAALIKGLEQADAKADWDYALNRLITGLSSSRGAARLGFSMALSELLSLRKEEISVQEYLERSEGAFLVSGKVKGPEERGLLFGKLFALQTLAKSPLWHAASFEDVNAFIDACIDLSLTKRWLAEPAIYALCELIPMLEKLDLDRSAVLTSLFNKIHEKGLSKTCEGVAVALSVTPEERTQYNGQSDWKGGDPLAKSNLTELARVLRDMPVADEDERKNWKPSIHFVWAKILVSYTKSVADQVSAEEPPHKKQRHHRSETSSANNHLKLTEFWKTVIDDSYFASKASPERKLWGFEILNAWLPHISDVGALLTPNLVRSLTNQLSQNDRFLHKMAKRVVSVLIDVAQTRKKAGSIVEALIRVNPHFDKMSKTKTVQDLLALLRDDLEQLVSVILHMFKYSSDFAIKQWALDAIVQIVKVHKSDDMSWLSGVLRSLAESSFFDKSSAQEAALAQQRLMSILSNTMGATIEEVTLPYYVQHRAIKLQEKGLKPRIDFEGDFLKAKVRAEATVEKIHKKRLSSRHVDTPQLQAFELLFSMVLIQVYATDTEAVAILDELQMVYNSVAAKQTQQDASDIDIDSSQVLTEILLSFLSQQSTLLRKVSEDVWSSFSGQVTLGSLELLFDILESKEGIEGQEELFDVSDNVIESEVDNDNEESGQDSIDESEESGDSDADEDDEDIALDQETERALAVTLGVKDVGNNDIDESSDNDDDDEESMDDEQMSALDTQLAAIFKDRQLKLSSSKQQKKDSAKAKLNITLLKSRVLDLLDIFVAKQPSNTIGLHAILPVLRLIQHTKDQAVSDKARELVRNRICRKTQYILTTAEEVELATSILGNVMEQAATSTTKSHTQAVNQVGVFASKLLVNFDAALIKVVSRLYSKALVSWFEDAKNKTQPGLWSDLVNFLANKRRDT